MLRRLRRCCCREREARADRARLLPSRVDSPLRLGDSLPPLPTGGKNRKRALLIGVNYVGSPGELQGCCNDVERMREFLVGRGWPLESILVLKDERRGATDHPLPTRANILVAMAWLVAGTAAGDVLFFHFSGHGGQGGDTHGDEEDGFDETICPLDFQKAGQITDDELFMLLVKPLPAGVRLTALLDCCHSGHGMDFPYTLHHDASTGAFAWTCDPHVRHANCDCVLLSGCQDNECSADVAATRYAQPAGAMTSAVLDALSTHPALTYPALLVTLHSLLAARGFDQVPQISTTSPFALHRPVALDDASSASSVLGPVMFVPRAPSVRRSFDGGFGEMLSSADASALVAGALAAHAMNGHSMHGANGGGWLSGLFGGGLFGGSDYKYAAPAGAGHGFDAAHDGRGAPFNYSGADEAEDDEYDDGENDFEEDFGDEFDD